MKMFKIRINGNEYHVEVEEVTSAASPAPARAAQPTATRPAPQEMKKPASPAAAPVQNGAATIQAPMPGTILDIRVKGGDKVGKGQTLMILEAMKMENEILAPHDCVIGRVQVEKGASVNAGDVLITLS